MEIIYIFYKGLTNSIKVVSYSIIISTFYKNKITTLPHGFSYTYPNIFSISKKMKGEKSHMQMCHHRQNEPLLCNTKLLKLVGCRYDFTDNQLDKYRLNNKGIEGTMKKMRTKMTSNDNYLGCTKKIVDEILQEFMDEPIDKISEEMKIPNKIIYEIVWSIILKFRYLYTKQSQKEFGHIIEVLKGMLEKTYSPSKKSENENTMARCEKEKELKII